MSEEFQLDEEKLAHFMRRLRMAFIRSMFLKRIESRFMLEKHITKFANQDVR